MENTEKKTLIEKLFEFQSMGIKFIKESDNPFFGSKYASLEDMLTTLNPILKELRLVIVHFTEEVEQKNKVITQLINVDNEKDKIQTSFLLLPDLEPQKVGSAITYAKRYNIGQLLNIITDEDDDGNSSTPSKKTEPKKDNFSGKTTRPASEKQINYINNLLQDKEVDLDLFKTYLKTTFKIDKVEGLMIDQAKIVIDTLLKKSKRTTPLKEEGRDDAGFERSQKEPETIEYPPHSDEEIIPF
jgi:hypothetical protein